MATKECIICGANFYALRNTKTCSAECSRERDRAWRADPVNREREREQQRAWRADPVNRERERRRERDRAWYADPVNRERKRERVRARYADPVNRERKREQNRAYYIRCCKPTAGTDLSLELQLAMLEQDVTEFLTNETQSND